MNNENTTSNEEKIRLAYSKNLKVHLVLKKDRSWRNGIVTELSNDFFLFEDEENGEEPFFFIELFDVRPFVKGGVREKEKGEETEDDRNNKKLIRE